MGKSSFRFGAAGRAAGGRLLLIWAGLAAIFVVNPDPEQPGGGAAARAAGGGGRECACARGRAPGAPRGGRRGPRPQAASLPVFQLSRPAGGRAALPGTRGPGAGRRGRRGRRGGGAGGEGGAATRAQASRAAAGPSGPRLRGARSLRSAPAALAGEVWALILTGDWRKRSSAWRTEPFSAGRGRTRASGREGLGGARRGGLWSHAPL